MRETFWTVRELARLAGVSVRTLHYYDEIGLLSPARRSENGYRQYSRDDLLRLQQILFYRELGLPLKEIACLLAAPDFNPLQALQVHRAGLLAQRQRLETLLRTVENTIRYLEGAIPMTPEQIFEPFSEKEQAAYAREAEGRYDPQVVRASQKRWQAYGKEKQAEILAEGNRIYADLVAAMPQGPASPAVQALVARWHRHIEYFWSPEPQQLLGLAQLYGQDERFRKKFTALHPDLPAFFLQAVQIYVEKLA
jgi:DNA-binding transcriptional MerR regulator